MRLFRRNRLSEEQLHEVLRSLPQMKAPEGLEDRLGRITQAQKNEVPHILGSLPLVPAPEDFDARLREAIHDRRRPIAPITSTPIADAVMRVNWLTNIMGWVGGAVMVVTLAFVVDRSGFIEQQTEPRPESVPAAVSSMPSEAPVKPQPPAPQTAPVGRRESPDAQREVSIAVSTPAAGTVTSSNSSPVSSQAAPVTAQPAQRQAPVSVSMPASTSAAPSVSAERERNGSVRIPMASQPAATPTEEQPANASAAELTGGEDPATISSENTAPAEGVDTGMVDTGGERGNANDEKP